MSPTLGGSVDRVDGRRKVTGAAQYAADYTFERLAYAVPVLSKTGKGRVKSIDSAAAREPGVLAVLTRDNCPKLSHTANDFGSWTKLGEARLPFEDDEIHYAGQVLAVVIADSLEQATAAAMRMKIEVDEQPPAIHVEESMGAMYVPKGMGFAPIDCSRGDVAAGATGAAFSIDAQYSTPAEHHNPMEPAATTAVWTDGDLTLYDATQWVMGARNAVADVLGLDRERVRIVSQFVGGGFGCKGFTWPHQVLAAVAARMVNRPVKLALSRQMMYTGCGHRPQTQQHVALAADADGRLRAIRHDTINSTSTVDEFVESCGVITPFLYECPNIAVTHRVVPINIATPTPMRAPGENPGLFALECALDELAFNAGIDPVELRIRNHADRDPEKNLPWSSKYLKECYARGREKSGWDRRNPKPGSMKENGSLIGYGMATATYPGYRMQGAAVVRLHDDGTVSVGSATQDIGGGTYTIMALVAADALGVPLDSIRPALGDSRLPPAPVSGGSMTTERGPGGAGRGRKCRAEARGNGRAERGVGVSWPQTRRDSSDRRQARDHRRPGRPEFRRDAPIDEAGAG
jgi:xanthine dehydrogenase YagR molybdenum-binding subunit